MRHRAVRVAFAHTFASPRGTACPPLPPRLSFPATVAHNGVAGELFVITSVRVERELSRMELAAGIQTVGSIHPLTGERWVDQVPRRLLFEEAHPTAKITCVQDGSYPTGCTWTGTLTAAGRDETVTAHGLGELLDKMEAIAERHRASARSVRDPATLHRVSAALRSQLPAGDPLTSVDSPSQPDRPLPRRAFSQLIHVRPGVRPAADAPEAARGGASMCPAPDIRPSPDRTHPAQP